MSIAGLRGHQWAPTALLAASAAWSLTWIGVLLNVSGFVVRSPLVGYWFIFVSIGVVVAGGDRRLDLEPSEHDRQPSAE